MYYYPIDWQGVLQLNQYCEVFIDLSAWQAFGRAGIEAMASGVVPILPSLGGAPEYATHGTNAFLVDTSDMKQVRRSRGGRRLVKLRRRGTPHPITIALLSKRLVPFKCCHTRKESNVSHWNPSPP